MRSVLTIGPLYVLFVGFILFPVFLVSIPPLADYPNHLARMHILSAADPAGNIDNNYLTNWRLIPDLAMDLIVLPLSWVMPLEIAGRLFIILTCALLVLGTICLHRTLYGRVGLWPLASLLFMYNYVLLWGFLNFLFTAGLSLLTFSAWIASERWHSSYRIPLFAAISALLLLFHLFAFGFYGLLILSFELGNSARRNALWSEVVSLSTKLLQFLPSILLWGFSLKNAGPIYYGYGTLLHKFFAVMAPFIFNTPPALPDLMTFAAALSLFYVGFRSGALRLAPKMRAPLAAMIIVAVLMPEWTAGSWSADIRLPVLLPFVAIGATELKCSRKIAAVLLALSGLALLTVRVWAVSQTWIDADRRFNEVRLAAQNIAPGSRLLQVASDFPDREHEIDGVSTMLALRSPISLLHIAALAVIDRDVFIPSLFTGWTPIAPSGRNAGMSRTLGGVLSPAQLLERSSPLASEAAESELRPNALGEPPCCYDWPKTFDYVLWVDFGEVPKVIPDQLELSASGSFFHIYRVKK
jgi:hypothetical protein